MSEHDNHTPLIGDTARQATASLLGYDYQIWRSVEAWLQLRETETLFLEVGEDYDIVATDGATAVQIKSSSEDISLGVQEIRDTIENFWNLQVKNANRGLVNLKFLTRGTARHEQGKPFGESKGLDVWAIAATGCDASTKAIADFFDGRFTGDLARLLKEGTPADIRDKLIGRIDWVMGEGDFDVAQANIDQALIELGNRRNKPPSVSVAARDGLLEHCRSIARKSAPELRRLTREKLDWVFERKTGMFVPMTNANVELLSLAIQKQYDGQGFNNLTIAAPVSSFEPPRLPDPFFPRAELIEKIAANGADSVRILVAGTEGRGKTTVANLLARRLNVECLWVDLAGLEDYAIGGAIDRAIAFVSKSANAYVVVLDDLPVSEGVSALVWGRLLRLLEACKDGKHALILTAKGVNENMVDSRFRANRVEVISVPDLTVDEISNFFRELGCPSEKEKGWATITHTHTGGGHPGLVYLRALELSDTGWPAFTGNDFVTAPHSIGEARAAARLSASRLLSPQDLEFLYLLSLSSLPFEREVAQYLGGTVEGLTTPGDSFDRMVGRWIENVGQLGFRATSLLSNQASFAWSKNRLKEAHGLVFDAFLSRESVRPNEVFSLFVHTWLAENPERFIRFVITLVTCEPAMAPILYENLRPLIHLRRGVDEPAITFDAKCSALFRNLQFRIAGEVEEMEMNAISLEWRHEIMRMPPSSERDRTLLTQALSTAISSKGKFSPNTLIQSLVDIASLSTLIDEFGIDVPLPIFDQSFYKGGKPDLLPILFGFMNLRCKEIAFLEELLVALQPIEPTIRSRLFEAYDAPVFRDFSLFIDSSWVGESKKETPDWQNAEKVLRRASDLALEWGHEPLFAHAIKALSIVVDEYLGEKSRALAIIDEGLRHYPKSFVLIGQASNVQFGGAELQKSLDGWRLSLSLGASDDPTKITEPFAFRKAGMASGRLGLLTESAEWFERGAGFCSGSFYQSAQAGFWADASYSHFKAKNWPATIRCLCNAVQLLPDDYDRNTQFQLFATQKLVANSCLWMLGEVKHGFGEGGAEPIFGCCSNAEKHEGIRDLPSGPVIVFKGLLLTLALYLNVQTPELDEIKASVESSKLPSSLVTYRMSQVASILRHGQNLDLANILLNMYQALALARAHRRLGLNTWVAYEAPCEEQDFAGGADSETVMLCAFLLHVLEGGSGETLFARWREVFEASPNSSGLCEDLNLTWRAVTISAAEATAVVMNANNEKFSRLAAAVRLLCEPNRVPENTALMQPAVLTWLFKSPARSSVEESIIRFAALFSNQWRPHLSQPILLINPRMSIPQLRDAIEYEGHGSRKLIKLFDAASFATGTVYPSTLRTALENLERFEINRAT